MSRIRQTLTLQTSLGAVPLNFTLQATIPANALSLCAATLPRPTWEPLLYYAAVLSMGFLLFGVMVASYFEADRISVADIIRRRTEMSHAATAFEKGRMFDLRSISRSGLSQGACDADADEMLKNGGITSAFGSLSMNCNHRSRFTSEITTNGHVPLSKMWSSGDSQRSGHLGFTFFERLFSRRSRSRSTQKSASGVLSDENATWVTDDKSGAANRSASGNGPQWNFAWLGVSAFRFVVQHVNWLASKLTHPSTTAVCTKSTSTSTGEDSRSTDAWPDNRHSPVSDCESVPGRDVDDNNFSAMSKPDAKCLHLRRDKSSVDQVSASASSEHQAKTGYCSLGYTYLAFVYTTVDFAKCHMTD